ncbi:alpha/beta hydrolase [Aureisphaera galaxeae]|uniref:alpha/beta hydrolase n=1 Tax=Aureisphaera galaxeae TaxID=1538023 RepID=UPI0023502691|nr:alpha/beta hydrolase [Aureisphaera galaxeae]MDC8003415.1 alpha/beta hydrolase [Aureisphaera galaxeae]
MNTKILYLLIGVCIALTSCTTQQEAEPAIITGKVNIYWSNTIKLASGPVTLTDSWIDRLSVGDSIIDLNEDGTFKIELLVDKPNFHSLSHETNSVELFLSPGDSLHVDFTSETLFSGIGGQLNNHMKSLRDIINANRRYINGKDDFFSQPSAAYNAVLDSLEQVYLNAHHEFRDMHHVDPVFEDKVMADISYRKKLYQIVHPSLFNYQTNEKLPVEKTYFEAIAQGTFDNPDLLKSLDYVLFLDGYMDVQSTGDYKFGYYMDAPIEKIHPKYEQIQQLEAHQDIKDYLYHEHLHKSIDNYGISYLEDLIPQFREDCKNPEFIRRIDERVQTATERKQQSSAIKIYKTVGNVELEAHIFYPEDFKEGDQRPAYLFFHGGGWSMGIPEWGYKNCKKYRDKGMVAISFEYRLIDIHNSNLLDCVRDAKSAILWTRKEAESLGIDPDKIVAAGFSAGGHLAACTAILDEYEEQDNSGLSSKPNAIIVHSASYNTLKGEWFSRKSEQKAESISTFHQVDKGLVPSIFFHGTNDHLAPISEFTEFRDKMDALGNDYEYKIFENVGHFFNDPAARETVGEMTDAFLTKLGYIE